MSGNCWNQPGVPHKGWHCVDVVDLRVDGEFLPTAGWGTAKGPKIDRYREHTIE